MKFDTRIALRYIFSFGSFHFISIISFISFLGIVIGVAAIITATSVFNGFREFTENQLIGLDPHIRILPKNGAWLPGIDSLLKQLEDLKEIKAASPVIQGKLIAIKNKNLKLIVLNGVKSEDYSRVSGVEKSVIIGKFRLKDMFGLPMLCLGGGLCDQLRVLPGDSLKLVTLSDIESSVLTLSDKSSGTLKISGIFQTHNNEYDDSYGYTDFEEACHLLKVPPDNASFIDIRLKNLDEVPAISKEMQKRFPFCNTQTWYDLHKDLYNVMQLERVAVFIILSLIVLLAIFNILASISMTVIEKRKDIGILIALGSRTRDIRNIFLKEGILLGTIGTIFGTILGLGLCWGQMTYGWYKLSADKYLITAIPVSIHASDIILVVVISLVLSIVSGYFPSKTAAEATVVESLREE